jgi:hypothetical protein
LERGKLFLFSWNARVSGQGLALTDLELQLERLEAYMDCVDQLRQEAPTGDYQSAFLALFL